MRRRRFKLAVRLLPRRAPCLLLLNRHRWAEPDAVIIDGPIHLPPRERDWRVIAFHQQCERCYTIRDVPHTPEQDARAIEDDIRMEEQEADGVAP